MTTNMLAHPYTDRLESAEKGDGRPRQESWKMKVAGLELDFYNRSVRHEGMNLGCTETEFLLLAELLKYAGQVLPATFLAERVWGHRNGHDASRLKHHIHSLRRKLRDAGRAEDMLWTVEAVGFSFTPV